MPTVYRKVFTDETEEELKIMTRDEVTLELSDKQRAFCEYYVGKYNIKTAAIKAGYSKKSAHIFGWKLRTQPDCNRYIAWLKLRIANDLHVDVMDIIDQYIRIAFADVTDFVKIENGKLKLIDADSIDGQLITKIRQGPHGITIELADKLRAMEKLEHYFDVMPKDWRQKIEEKKLELMRERIEIERIKAGQQEVEDGDDGFIEALKDSAKETWGDE